MYVAVSVDLSLHKFVTVALEALWGAFLNNKTKDKLFGSHKANPSLFLFIY